MPNFISLLDNAPVPTKGNAYESIFAQYERVIIQSLLTSFGLDFIVRDQHGGDVDTIHNVRAMDTDSKLYYKDAVHAEAYLNRGAYNSREYHSHKNYIAKNREVSAQKKSGSLIDAYTGKRISAHERSDLDHIVSAKELHDDRARVLSGLNGADLANNPDNLAATNPHTNRTKKAMSMDEFLDKKGDEYTQEHKELMRNRDRKARQNIDRKINYAYYTSPDFFRSSAVAATKIGFAMGARQVLGLVFSEIWFAIRAEFKNAYGKASSLLHKVATGFKKGLANAKKRYKELWDKFVEGAFSGVLSSITTTVCNIFFTTAKGFIRILRQIWSSLVEAAKILFFNPDCLPLGERFRAAAKILATGASVVVGTLITEAISTTGLGTIPVLGDIVSTFIGALVSGVMACTLLYALDKNALIDKLIQYLNNLPTFSNVAFHYRQLSVLLDEYCAKVMDIDLEHFKQETESLNHALSILDSNDVDNQEVLNIKLRSIYRTLGIAMPYDTNKYQTFDDFMEDEDSILVFK